MIRWATEGDYPACSEMLTAEGIPPEEQCYEKRPTWVYDDNGIAGFLTMTIVNNRPAIQHICVRRDMRLPGAKVVRELLRFFKDRCRATGNDRAYAHADKDKPATKKAIEYYFKVKPYAEDDKRHWYFLKIGGNDENL